MSSLAQEESRSISENCIWGIRKKFEEGKVRMSFGSFLGYEKDDDGNIVINKKEAQIVQLLYSRFLQGLTPGAIAKELEVQGVKTARGEIKWYGSTIKSILENEKYTGNAILQKTYSTDFLSKKRKINNGEVPKYYVENSHPAIVTQEQFDLVQSELNKRTKLKNKNISTKIFANKVICGDCGSVYGSKLWHSTSKYRRTVWQCNNKFKNKEKCTTPHFREEELKQISLDAINKLVNDKEAILEECNMIVKQLLKTKDLKLKEEELTNELDVVSALIEKLIGDNSTSIQNQVVYKEKYNELSSRYYSVKEKLDLIQEEIDDKHVRKIKIKKFLKTLEAQNGFLTSFSPEIFKSLVERIEVYSKDEIKVIFKNGYEI
ncbi:MAG: recombinase family protein [Candidatus Neomarinimicrobiota bacterium]